MKTVDPFGLCPDLEREATEQNKRDERIELAQITLAEARAKYSILKASVDQQEQEVQKAVEHLQSICDHKDVEVEKSYFSGSYYDRAYTTKRIKCKICGSVSEWTREDHSWYG